MLATNQYQGSDDSDSEDDQFTEGNRDSIGNFLGPQHEAAEAEEDSSSSDEDGATVAADDDAAALALLSATAVQQQPEPALLCEDCAGTARVVCFAWADGGQAEPRVSRASCACVASMPKTTRVRGTDASTITAASSSSSPPPMWACVLCVCCTCCVLLE